MNAIARLAAHAAEQPYVTKLAEDAGLAPEQIRHLAAVANLPAVTFCKRAYDEPEAFGQLVGLVLTKQAGRGQEDAALLSEFRNSGDVGLGRAGHVGGAGLPKPGPGVDLPAGLVGRNSFGTHGLPTLGGVAKQEASQVPSVLQRLRRAEFGGSSAVGRTLARGAGRLGIGSGMAGGRAALLGRLGLGGAGLGLGALGLSALSGGGGGGGGEAAAGGASPAAAGAAAAAGGASPAGAGAAAPQMAAAGMGGAGGGGMPTALKALLAAGGVGAGAYGLSRLFSRKKKDKAAADAFSPNPVIRAMQRAVLTKVAKLKEKLARDQFVRYLGVVADRIKAVEKRAQVHLLQAQVSMGTPLSVAIKQAYPMLSGEERGVFAHRLCKAASDYHAARTKTAAQKKRANSMQGYAGSGNGAAGMGAGVGGGNAGGLNTTSPISATGPASAASSMMGQVGP